MDGFILQNKNNIWFGSFAAFTELGFGNAFSCRLHGESSLVPGGFNLALHVSDDAGMVLANRRQYAAALGVDAAKFTTCEQVHGDCAAVVDAALVGKGALAYADAVKGTDALVTDLPDVPLLLFFADCVPIIFAGIGPCIGKCCYEVDDTVYSAGQKHAACFTKKANGKYMADLQEWNRQSLLEAGVLPQHIYNAAVCTECNKALFFSYRAESGKTGRMGVTIWKNLKG